MKNSFVFLFLFLAIVLNSNAQESTDDSDVYSTSAVDKQAEFVGGRNEFYKYIGENYVQPSAKEFKGGLVLASFVVEKDGSIGDVKVLRDPGFGTADEAIRVLKSSPLWMPAELDGKKVRVLYSIPIKLQEPTIVEEVDENKIYNSPEVQIKPQFTGGSNKFLEYIKENYIAPNRPGLKGKVYVMFTVETDGSLIDIKVLKDIGFGTGDEAVRVLKRCPKWTPAKIDGKAVRCSYQLPISLEIPFESEENSRSLQRRRW